MLKYQIRNDFQSVTATSVTVSGGTTDISKSITIPINLEFFPVDYGEGVDTIVKNERNKRINPTLDGETVKYWYQNINNPVINNGNGLYINFKFWDANTNKYSQSYSTVGITDDDILRLKNGFRKSFFRLYFYDSNSGDTANLLFTEDLNVYENNIAKLKFNRLYWLRNDEFFVKNNTNKTVYMNASFFNAKTGKINRFINTPFTITQPITITQYSDPNNRKWRTSAITIINPKLNNGEYNFIPVPNWGDNTANSITLSEFITQ